MYITGNNTVYMLIKKIVVRLKSPELSYFLYLTSYIHNIGILYVGVTTEIQTCFHTVFLWEYASISTRTEVANTHPLHSGALYRCLDCMLPLLPWAYFGKNDATYFTIIVADKQCGIKMMASCYKMSLGISIQVLCPTRQSNPHQSL